MTWPCCAALLIATNMLPVLTAGLLATLTPLRPARVGAVVASASVEQQEPPLSGLKKLALSQANAAAATIVETNTLLDPVARECTECKPTARAWENQEKALLPVPVRAALARGRLWGAYKLLALVEGKGQSTGVRAVLSRASTVALRVTRSLLVSAGVAYAALLVARDEGCGGGG